MGFKPRHLLFLLPLVFCVLGIFPRLLLGVSNDDVLQYYYQQTTAMNGTSSSLDTAVIMMELENSAREMMAYGMEAARQGLQDVASAALLVVEPPPPQVDWCTQVQEARSNLRPSLHIQVPCEKLKPAKSAIVCMLTDGVANGHENNKVFSATNYIHGAMALGASLMDHIDHEQTHQLLLVREGFTIADDDMIRLESAGWTVGTAPNVPLMNRYVPSFPRYKTTYTKITAIGLAEYDCVMLMDADTLAVGDLREIMSCNLFTEPQHRVGGTLDWYRGRWHFFNTGCVLYRTDSMEMERVFNLTVNNTFMRKFGSDQDFLNHVYPERLNNTINNLIMDGNMSYIPNGTVVDMTWAYNAQTHAEVQRPEWFEAQRPSVRILHFTEKKGWHCERGHDAPPPLSEMPRECSTRAGKNIPICYCRNGHFYWDALIRAQTIANQTIALKQQQEQQAEQQALALQHQQSLDNNSSLSVIATTADHLSLNNSTLAKNDALARRRNRAL